MTNEEKQNLEQQLKKIGVKEIPRYAFFKDTYMALPLPLSVSVLRVPLRVHEWLFTLFPRVLALCSFGFAIGTFMYKLISTSLNFTCLKVTSILSAIILAFGIYCCYKLVMVVKQQVKQQAEEFQTQRKPKK